MKTYTLHIDVEVEDGVYWPEWVQEDSSWNDDLGMLMAFYEGTSGSIVGMRVRSVSAQDEHFVPNDVVDADSERYIDQYDQQGGSE